MNIRLKGHQKFVDLIKNTEYLGRKRKLSAIFIKILEKLN